MSVWTEKPLAKHDQRLQHSLSLAFPGVCSWLYESSYGRRSSTVSCRKCLFLDSTCCARPVTASARPALTLMTDRVNKRPRVESEDADVQIACYHKEFNYDDGSLVLHVENTLFRIHRSILASHSEFCADMLKVPQPANSLTVDGCPVVHLPDTPGDFVDLLKALYNPWYGTENRIIELIVTRFYSHFDDIQVKGGGLHVVLTFVAGILRLSTKYCFQSLRAKCLQILKQKLPTTYHAARVSSPAFLLPVTISTGIQLAREARIPTILPFLLYECTRLRPNDILQDEDLSWKDKAICLAAQAELFSRQHGHYAFYSNYQPPFGCEHPLNCTKRFEMAIPNLDGYHILLALSDSSRPRVSYACTRCQQLNFSHIIKARAALWEALPSIFKLEDWGQLEKDEGA